MNYPRLITYANFGYLKFGINLIENFKQRCNKHKMVFYCLDDKIFNYLNNLYSDISNLSFEKVENINISNSFQNYGSYEYNKITHTKVKVLLDALNKYDFIHFIDCDVVCIKEPELDYYSKYLEFDIVFQFDCGLGHGHGFYNNWVCTGNTLLRNTKGTMYILNKIQQFQDNYTNKNDQECLKEYFDQNNIKDIRDEKNAKLTVFPYEEYTNGWILNNKYFTLENTYFFHANHVIGNESKIRLLKEANSWFE